MNGFLRLFKPDEYWQAVTDINFDALRNRGIEALLVDLDNTLVPWRSTNVHPEIAEWVKKAHGLGMKMCIVSNTNSRKRIELLAQVFGIYYVKGPLKPRSGGFREAMRVLEVGPEQSAVIGDQIFTDILGGNRLGLHTILVRPMQWREFVGTKISRLFEMALLRHFDVQVGSSSSEPAQWGTIGANQPSEKTE